jgi:hypothetical protein
MIFLLLLLDDRRIRIRNFDYWIRIRIRVDQKHMDPMDPNPDGDPDPQHWILKHTRMMLLKPNIGQQYTLFRYKSGHIRPLKDKKRLKYPT